MDLSTIVMIALHPVTSGYSSACWAESCPREAGRRGAKGLWGDFPALYCEAELRWSGILFPLQKPNPISRTPAQAYAGCPSGKGNLDPSSPKLYDLL